ncbi:MAG TPA: hypothetical protein VFH47_09015 [Candidatus Thermoplasmatota archaeon]|nr:hypothetical protein [Candidatus Thermoplasmatota archaeon]
MAMRWGWTLAALAASIAITAILWMAGFPGFFLFLAFPFLFAWPRRRSTPAQHWGAPAAAAAPLPRACPSCGWSSMDPDARFCPRDGQALQ